MDLAENVDDLICISDGTGDRTMDTLAMYLFAWILVAFVAVWAAKYAYEKLLASKKKAIEQPKAKAESPTKVDGSKGISAADIVDVKAPGLKKSNSAPKSGAAGGKTVPATPPVRKRLTRQSPAPDLKKTKYIPAPQCTGPDNISVLWVNDVFQWLFNDRAVIEELIQVWINSLNAFCKKSDAEVSVISRSIITSFSQPNPSAFLTFIYI